MPTYEVLVADGLLPEFTNDNPAMPAGLQVQEALLEPDARQGVTRVRISDENAPAWTEGKLVDLTFTAHYNDDGTAARATVSGYALLVSTTEEAAVESVVNPGVTVTVRP